MIFVTGNDELKTICDTILTICRSTLSIDEKVFREETVLFLIDGIYKKDEDAMSFLDEFRKKFGGNFNVFYDALVSKFCADKDKGSFTIFNITRDGKPGQLMFIFLRLFGFEHDGSTGYFKMSVNRFIDDMINVFKVNGIVKMDDRKQSKYNKKICDEFKSVMIKLGNVDRFHRTRQGSERGI